MAALSLQVGLLILSRSNTQSKILMQLLAGDLLNLVIHIYATGSPIDITVKEQNKTSYATTLEDDSFWDAIMDDTDDTDNSTYGSIDGDNFTAAAVVQLAGNFKYFGCQHDRSTSRTLSSISAQVDNLTVEACAKYCDGYLYMGVEAGSGYVLFLCVGL